MCVVLPEEAEGAPSNTVLGEARTLTPAVWSLPIQAVKGTPEGSSIGTFVNFRMLHNKEAPVSGKHITNSEPLV